MIKREHLWPIGIVAALATNVIFTVVTIRLANQPGTEVVEADYYRKAVAWDSTSAIRDASAKLGWTLDAAITPTAPSRARLAVTLADDAGAPIEAANVKVTAIHNRRAEHPVTATLARDARGYGADLPLDRPGLWELRFEVRRGTEVFTSTLRRERPAS